MTHDDILKELREEAMTVEEALQELCEIGVCPNLLNDDDGRWAVVFEGIQDPIMGDEAQDINTSFFVEANQWKPSIREALIMALYE